MATPTIPTNTTKHKNILLLIADDLGIDTLGSYGNPSVKTPHLDALSATSTRFTSAFTSTASCSASRSCIYTGLHAHESGQYGLNTQDGLSRPRTHFTTFETVETAPLLFNHRGYMTGIVGKVHVGSPKAYPWEVREESGTRDVVCVAERCEEFFGHAVTTDRPFFLTVGFIDPHRDTSTRAGFGNEETCGGKIELPDFGPADVEVPEWLTDLPETRTELAEYYRAISRVDAGVGLILEGLERKGLSENTLVVFLSDNGPPFVNSKTTMYEAGIRLPLLIRAPGKRSGTVNPNMVSFIDILPTLLDWADSDSDSSIPPSRQQNTKILPTSPPRLGRSLLPILDSSTLLPPDTWSQHVFGSHTFHEIQNYWPTRYIRTLRFKYHRNITWRLDFPFASDLYASLTFEGIRNMGGSSATAAAAPDAAGPIESAKPADDTAAQIPIRIGSRSLQDYIFRPPESLHDLSADPHEIINLVHDPAYADVLKDLRARLEDWQWQTEDIWLVRDGVSVTVLKRYVDLGLRIPDRLDFDAGRPGSEGVPAWVVPGGDGRTGGVEGPEGREGG